MKSMLYCCLAACALPLLNACTTSATAASQNGARTYPVVTLQRHEIRSRFRIASAEGEQAFHRYRQRVLPAYNEVADHLGELRNYGEVHRLKEQQMAAREKGVTVAHELYLSGYASHLEIVTAQKSKVDAELELINTRRQLALATVSLYKAAGGGWQ